MRTHYAIAFAAVLASALSMNSAVGTPRARASFPPTGTVLTGGNILLDFNDFKGTDTTSDNADRVDLINWNGGSGMFAGQNLVAQEDQAGACEDASSFFGEAEGISLDASPDPAIIGPGFKSIASNQTATSLTNTTTGTDCDNNPVTNVIASTDYTVYPAGDPNVNEFRVARTFQFTPNMQPPFQSEVLRAYIPRLGGQSFIVTYPNAAGQIVEKDIVQCAADCVITDWNGQWYADTDDDGNGVAVFRDATSTAPAELYIRFETDAHFVNPTMANLTAIALIQPGEPGWQAPVTETEWVCFFDNTTWTFQDREAGNLPQGCAQSVKAAAPPDTTPDPFAFTAVTGVALSSTQTSNAVSITGINAAAPISVSGGSYSINGGAFVSAAGTVNSSDSVIVKGTASASYATATSVILTAGGVSGTFSITTQAAPPPPLAATTTSLSGHAGGGGGMGLDLILALSVLVAVRALSFRRASSAILPCAVALIAAAPVHAQVASSDTPSGYVGIRAGVGSYQFSEGDLLKSLGSLASEVDSSSISRQQFAGAVYGGLPVYRDLMAELSYMQLGQYPVSLRTTTTDPATLARRVVTALAPAGHGVTAGLALPLAFGARFGIEPRIAALYYESKQVVSTQSTTYRDDGHGFGLDAGMSLTLHVSGPIHLGIGADCLHLTQACNVLLFSAQVEYRLAH